MGAWVALAEVVPIAVISAVTESIVLKTDLIIRDPLFKFNYRSFRHVPETECAATFIPAANLKTVSIPQSEDGVVYSATSFTEPTSLSWSRLESKDTLWRKRRERFR